MKAAGVTIEPYWAGLFAKLLATKNVGDLIANVGSGATPAEGKPYASGAVAQRSRARNAPSSYVCMRPAFVRCIWGCVAARKAS